MHVIDTFYNIPISHIKLSKEYNPNFIFENTGIRKSFYTIITKLKRI